MHATLVADRAGGKAEKPEKSDLLKAHDIRFKVETTEPIKTSSKSRAYVGHTISMTDDRNWSAKVDKVARF